MFPRNENRNEGTFAKTTLLETALLSPSDPFRGFAKGWFPKGWFRRMFPRNENRNEGTFAKTTLAEAVASDHRTGQSISLCNRTGQPISL